MNVTRRALLAGSGRAADWVRHHPYYSAAIAAEVFVLFLPFYDPNNVPLALAATTLFTSSSPVFSHQTWVAGPFIDAAYVPMALGYVAGGNQLYWAYTTFKLILFGLTATMAYATYRAFLGRGEPVALSVAMFTLLNPIWFVVNELWVQYDLIPVAFLTLGFILLRWGGGLLPEVPRVLAACVLITISVFFYWFALAVVPLLIIYTPGVRAKMVLAGGLAATLGTAYAVSTTLLGNNIGVYAGALVGGNAVLNRSELFGIQHFVAFSAAEYAATLLILGLVVPIAGYLLRVSEGAVGLAVLSIFLLVSTVPVADNYVFIWPFAVFAFLAVPVSRFRMAYLWAAIAYPIAGLVLINPVLSNAQPDGVGVFLWTWALFHVNVVLLPTHAALAPYLVLFNGATFVAVGVSIIVVGWATHPRGDPSVTRPGQESSRSSVPTAHLRLPGRRRRVLAKWAVVFGVLVVAGLVFNSAFPDLTDYSGSGRTPAELILPQFYPDNLNVVQPIPGVSWGVNGNTLEIYPDALPMQFGRVLIDQGIVWTADLAITGPVARSTLLFRGSTIQGTLENNSGPNASAVAPLPISYAQGTTVASADRALLGHGPAATYFNGNATIEYNLTSQAFLNHSFVTAFNATRTGGLESTILFLNGTDAFLALVDQSSGPYLVYDEFGDANYTVARFPAALEFGAWGFVSWTVTAQGLWIDLNGWSRVVSRSLFDHGNTSIIFGRPDYMDGRQDAFSGNISPLYRSASPWPNSSAYRLVAAGVASPNYVDLPSPSLAFGYTSNLSGSLFTVNGTEFRAPYASGAFGFGKYLDAEYSVTCTIRELKVTQIAPDRFYLVPVFATFVLPYLMVAATFPTFRRLKGPEPTTGPFRELPRTKDRVGR